MYFLSGQGPRILLNLIKDSEYHFESIALPHFLSLNAHTRAGNFAGR